MTDTEAKRILEHIGDKVNRAHDHAKGGMGRDIDKAWRRNSAADLRRLGVITESEARQMEAALDQIEHEGAREVSSSGTRRRTCAPRRSRA